MLSSSTWPMENGFTLPPQDSIAPSIDRRHNKEQYKDHEWQSKKSLIKHYYIGLRKTLTQVMRIMAEEHDFYPTRKMYITHIGAWGFAKNCTQKRVSPLLHQLRERGAISKSKLGGEGNVVDAKKLEMYVKRAKIGVQVSDTEDTESMRGSDINTSPEWSKSSSTYTQGTQSSPLSSPALSCNEAPPQGIYEPNCPYRSWPKRFRLTESFPNGKLYEADSLGFRSYIAGDEERPCSQHCYCQQHKLSNDYTFHVHKSSDRMDITIFSDDLYEYLLECEELENLRDGSEQDRTVNGLVLLKHYNYLKKRIEFLRKITHPAPTIPFILSEMELLVDGLLADGEVLKSYGYEDLHEHGFLDYNLWKKFQEDSFEKDVLALDASYHEVDDESEDEFDSFSTTSEEQNSDKSPGIDVDLEQLLVSWNRDTMDAGPMQNAPATDVDFTSVNLTESPMVPSIIEAAKQGDEAQILLLLDQGADVNGPKIPAYYPIVEAIKAGHEAVVRLLLDRGADLNCRPLIFYKSPLFEAVRTGNEGLVRLLLDRGASTNGVWICDPQTPLVEAARLGHETIVLLLLDHEAEINNFYLRDKNLALFQAAKAGHQAVVQLLLDRGAVADLSWLISEPQLRKAATPQHKAVVQLLLGSNNPQTIWDRYYYNYRILSTIPSQRSFHRSTFTQYANIYNLSISFAEMLLHLSPHAYEDPDEHFMNHAMVACSMYGHRSEMQKFLEHGADINAVTRFGTALSAATESHEVKLIRSLIQQGADVMTAACILQSGDYTKVKAAELLKLESTIRKGQSAYSSRGGKQHSLERTLKLRNLHRQFLGQHQLMVRVAASSSTGFGELVQIYHSHRKTWQAGIKTVRDLSRGEKPTMAELIAYLCVVKAISETLQSDGAHNSTEPFFQDVARLEIIYTTERDRVAYRDAIFSMWGVVLDERTSSEGQVDDDVTIRFHSLASTLISKANEHFGLDCLNEKGFEQTRQAWYLRNNQVPPDTDSEDEIRNPQVFEADSQQVLEIFDTEPPDPDIESDPSPLQQKIHDKQSNALGPDPVVIFVMLGASFAIVIIFLRWLRNTFTTCEWRSNPFVTISTLKERYCNLKAYLGLEQKFTKLKVHVTHMDDEVEASMFDFIDFGSCLL